MTRLREAGGRKVGTSRGKPGTTPGRTNPISDESDSDDSASDEETRDEDTNTKIFSKFRSFPAVPTNFHATAICHPATYLNKVLLGSDDGRALLLNVKSGSAIYEFAAFAGGVREASP